MGREIEDFVDRLTLAVLTGVTVTLVVMMMIQCDKEDTIEHLGTQYDSVPFIVRTGGSFTIIQIEKWGTGLWVTGDRTVRTPAYDVALPESERTIYYRRYIVHTQIDADLVYVGWGIVQDTNYIMKDSLNPEKIILNY